MAIHERAIAHEAGHAVVALHLGLHLERIEVNSGRANCKVDLTTLENPLQQCIFFSGGAAGELQYFGKYDQTRFQSDLSMISARKRRDVKTLHCRSRKHRTSQVCFDKLRKSMATGWAVVRHQQHGKTIPILSRSCHRDKSKVFGPRV